MATDSVLRENIAINVKRRLELLGWSQVDLARKSGENQPTVNRVCRGENLAGVGVLHRIAEALGTSLDVLTAEPKEISRVNA